MARFLADEDFDNDIVRGVQRRSPGVDILRVQDVGLTGGSDVDVLAWAARHARVISTHDVNTLLREAYARVSAGGVMPGVFATSQSAPIADVIEDLILIAECSRDGEWDGQIRYLPL